MKWLAWLALIVSEGLSLAIPAQWAPTSVAVGVCLTLWFSYGIFCVLLSTFRRLLTQTEPISALWIVSVVALGGLALVVQSYDRVVGRYIGSASHQMPSSGWL